MAKFKFDGDWKALLFAHCEKFVAGFIVLVALMLVWTAMGKEGLPVGQLPTDIDEFTSRASNKISSGEWEIYTNKPESQDLTRGSIMTRVPSSAYRTEIAYDKPPFEYKPPRKDPRLFAVDDLQADAGFGTLAIRGSKGRPGGQRDIWVPRTAQGEREVKRLDLGGVGVAEDDIIRGARWAVVRGVVPTGEQEEEFLRVFAEATAYDPRSDYPLYYGYYVQRAEVTDDAELNWSDERLIAPAVIKAETKKWSTYAQPLVKATFVHQRLTYPLPPLLIRDWDHSVIHPKIPLSNGQGSNAGEPNEVAVQEPEEEPDENNGVVDLREGFDEEENARRRRRLAGDGREVPGRRQEVKRVVSAMKMFRFFDFDVEPGKKYRYRVRLMMRDVNYDRLFPEEGKEEEGNARVEVRFLDPKVVQRIQKTDSAELGYISTPWSDPSTVVTIPYEERIFSGLIAQPTKSGVDPVATIVIKKFDINTGDDASTKMELSRGSLVNTDSLAFVIDPKDRVVDSRENYSIRTGAILVDVSGGHQLAGNREKEMTQPGEILLMTASGRLIVRRELADLSEMQAYETLDNTRGFKAAAPSGTGGLLPSGDGGLIDSGDSGGLIEPDSRRKR